MKETIVLSVWEHLVQLQPESSMSHGVVRCRELDEHYASLLQGFKAVLDVSTCD